MSREEGGERLLQLCALISDKVTPKKGRKHRHGHIWKNRSENQSQLNCWDLAVQSREAALTDVNKCRRMFTCSVALCSHFSWSPPSFIQEKRSHTVGRTRQSCKQQTLLPKHEQEVQLWYAGKEEGSDKSEGKSPELDSFFSAAICHPLLEGEAEWEFWLGGPNIGDLEGSGTKRRWCCPPLGWLSPVLVPPNQKGRREACGYWRKRSCWAGARPPGWPWPEGRDNCVNF